MKTAFRSNDLCLILCLVFAPLCVVGEWDVSPLLASSLLTSLLLLAVSLAHSVNVRHFSGMERLVSLVARVGTTLMLAAALNGAAALMIPSMASGLRFAFGVGLSTLGAFLCESASCLGDGTTEEEPCQRLVISVLLGFALEWSLASTNTLLAENVAFSGACLLLAALLAFCLSRFIGCCTSGMAVAFAGGALACHQINLVVGRSEFVSLPWAFATAMCCLLLVTLFPLLPRRQAEVLSGEKPISHEVSDDKFERRLDEFGLSPQERAAVELTLDGKTSSQVAEILVVKPPTVRNYLQRAYRKVGVASVVELRTKLGGGTDNGDSRQEGRSSLRCGAVDRASCVSLAILAMLPFDAMGIPVADMLGWVPVGCMLGVALPFGGGAARRVVDLVSNLFLGLVTAFMLMSSERGWTPALLVLGGVAMTCSVACSVAGLVGQSAGEDVAACPTWMNARRLAASYLAALVLTTTVPQAWCLLIVLGGIAGYGLRVSEATKTGGDLPEGNSGGAKRDAALPDLVALYCGVILWDFNNAYSLFYLHPLCIPLLLFVALAAIRGLLENYARFGERQLVVVYAALGVVAMPLPVDAQRFIVAALFATAAGLFFSEKSLEGGALSCHGVLAFAVGVSCAISIERFDYIAASSPDLMVTGLMNGATLRVTVFATGSVLAGCLYWRERRSQELTDDINLSVELRVVQYLQARGLTLLESQIMFEVMRGRTTLEIAKDLSCSVGTINASRHKTYGLLGVHSRDQLIEVVGTHLGLSL